MAIDLPPGLEFRAMTSADVKRALQIIRDDDDDDAQCARKSYKRSLDDQFVLTNSGEVIGVTGARPIDGTDRSSWLSWTYLDPGQQRRGWGTNMLQAMIETFREMGTRKVFAMVSEDEGGGGRYGRAIQTYNRAGFFEELRHPDYYDAGETMIAMGLRIQSEFNVDPDDPDLRPPRLTDVDEIVETDDAYYIDWEFADGQGSSPADLARMIDRVRKWEGRVVFVSAASDAHAVAEYFQGAGFGEEGQLLDFYEDGINETHFRLDLT